MIDKYCVDQSNEQRKYEQIRQMDLIYSNAEVTIIAAAGEDASFGLPGVNEATRLYQPNMKIGGYHLTSTLPHPKTLVESSKWSTRGWTFQEAILSKRRLVFTDRQVLFDCNRMHSAEVIAQPLQGAHVNNFPTDSQLAGTSLEYLPPRETPSGPFVHKNPGDPTTIMSFVAEFNQRSLTYPEDRLNAMQGIFQSFSKSKWPLWHVMGVPIWNFRGPKTDPDTWHPPYTPRHAFVVGLSWKHIKSGQRNAHFPSWTWAGWAGKLDPEPLFYCPWCRLDATKPHSYSPKIWIQDSDNSLIRFPDHWRDLDAFLQQRPIKLYRFFYIESQTRIPLQMTNYRKSKR